MMLTRFRYSVTLSAFLVPEHLDDIIVFDACSLDKSENGIVGSSTFYRSSATSRIRFQA